MSGISDLPTLLRSVAPRLHDQRFVFCTIDAATYATLGVVPICTFREEEGLSVILEQTVADRMELEYMELWACITLTVHSALTAVGFLAAITGRLAANGVSVNPVSAYYHDHLFVPWKQREQAMEVLQNLG